MDILFFLMHFTPRINDLKQKMAVRPEETKRRGVGIFIFFSPY